MIDETLVSGALSSSQQRQIFVDVPLVKAGPTRNHTHGQSASDRNAGSATAALASRSLGLEPYYVQQSLSDVRKARDGDRSYHWVKDFGVPSRPFHFDPHVQAAVLVDVDHYIDMPNLLARFPGTYFVSTFQPTEAACSTGEFSFRFLPDNRVQYRVSGGAEYEHLVWDYRGDTLMVQISDLTTRSVVAYHVDRKKLNDHHVLIMLSVIGKFQTFSFVPSSLLIEGRPLERLEPVIGEHVVLDVMRPTGLFRSVAVVGQHSAVTVPKAAIDACHAAASIAKVPITSAMISSYLAKGEDLGVELPIGYAPVLASYIRAGMAHDPPVVYPPENSMVPIRFGKHDYDAPVPLAGFGSPLIGPCYGFASSYASDDRCISGRLEAFTQRPQSHVVPPRVASYMVEFAELLIPQPHCGFPIALDEVYDHQDRPSQRHILDEAHVSGPSYKRLWRAFVKKETYVKPTDPRNISTATPQAKLAYSSFLYAFHAVVMNNVEWYAFNKTPLECANRVAKILANAAHAVPSDASRFDGHVSWLARVLERIIMLRFFSPECHSELNERLDEQIGLPGWTSEGREYCSGYSRASGSPETSDLNSVLTAFIGYCAWRDTSVNGVRCSPKQAWDALGVYGGDDSLEGAVDPDALAKSAKIMGQDYKTIVVKRGSTGVEFLNRQFGPDVWHGDINSMANPSRLLSKLWVGPANLREPLERFAERLSGYYRMDRNSPVIGEITRLGHDLLGERTEGILTPWAGKYSLDTNWPNEDSGWMTDLFNQFIPDFDWDRFHDWIWSVRYSRDPQMLLQAPLCTGVPDTTKPSVTCVVGDEFVAVPQKPAAAEPPAEAEEQQPIPVVVEEAVQTVPDLTPEGLKKPRVTKQERVSKKKEPKEDLSKRPDLWKPPSDPDKLAEWTKKRKQVAHRLGIQI